MSPLRRHALRVADAELRRRRGLRDLSRHERHGVEALAAAVALRVADALESVAASEPALARALHELELYEESGGRTGSCSTSRGALGAGATGMGTGGAGGATGSGGAAARGTGAGATTGGVARPTG